MPFQLMFMNGSRSGSLRLFDQAEVSLGRDPRCEVRFDPEGDRSVSARHARILKAEDAYRLEDGSSNGTLVNGIPVREALLHEGDIIELGPGGPKLRFSYATPMALPAVAPTPQAGLAKVATMPGKQDRGLWHENDTGIEDPSIATAVAPLPKRDEQASDSGFGLVSERTAPGTVAPQRRDVQVAITLRRLPEGVSQTFEKPLVRLGRDPSSDLNFDTQRDLLVSYNHAKLSVIGGRVWLFDLESTNGTLVNGEPVSRHELRGGERLALGHGGPEITVSLRVKQVTTPAQQAEGRAVPTVYGAGAPIAGLQTDVAEALAQIPLQDRLTVGRAAACDVVLDSMYVSNRHAVIERDGGAVVVRDLGSANGVFVGGERVVEAQLAHGAEVVVGPFLLRLDTQTLGVFDTRTRTWVDAYNLRRIDRRTQQAFLDGVSLKIQPGEFLCILGPSGSGKSTLLKSLNGYMRADSGRVLLNNIDFYQHYEQLKHQVGYVPQDDIIHRQLTLERTLQYAALLRLPPGLGRAKYRERVSDVLSMLELADHRQTLIRRLSGGQRKRASIAVELLTEPAIIYLDEPTSGLDPNLEEKMMVLLRDLTLRGKTVVAVTHTLDNIQLADKVAFLVDGQLAFLGSDAEARSFFQVDQLPDIYKRLDEMRGKEQSPNERFIASSVYKKNVANQLSTTGVRRQRKPTSLLRRRTGPGLWRQFRVLCQRYIEITTRDVRNTLLLLLQAPVVALLISVALQSDDPRTGPTSTLFLVMSLSALWFGCSNAARELTKERSIFSRERKVQLGVLPYVGSKFAVLQILALIQVAVMLSVVSALRSGYTLAEIPHACERWNLQACGQLVLGGVPGPFGWHLLNLYLTALCGIGIGLLISAVADNSDKAMSLVPLLLIPQVLFSGAFGAMDSGHALKRGIGYGTALNWSLDQAKRIAMCSPSEEEGSQGCTRCIHAYDPIKHRRLGDEPQFDDATCTALLDVTAVISETPEVLHVVEDGLYTTRAQRAAGPSRLAHRSFRGLYVQGGMALVLFVLVCLFVRRQHKSD